MLTIQAKKVAVEAAVSPFSASGCWVNGFKARHRLSGRGQTLQGQQSPADLDDIATGFAAQVEDIKENLSKRGDRTVWVKWDGALKKRAIVMLRGDSTGYRYPPFVVVKTASSKDPTTQAEDTKMRCGLEKKVWSEIMPLRDQFDMSIHINPKANPILSLSSSKIACHISENDISAAYTEIQAQSTDGLNIQQGNYRTLYLVIYPAKTYRYFQRKIAAFEFVYLEMG
uniref:AlNc14C71G4873 protein n=1 Tax=Albugo laibachii Nc14 TaxID=890382 RepID=F0WE08_9STRA|nr:AlNc14C71G4873 [Albugo laibachii Nc14]|eukprot:CCA19437.1 AlNc14C71G4873 [Albugo laibachii Nc14]